MADDEPLEAAYEDANGDPHGIGSPEWEEDADEYAGTECRELMEDDPDDYL